MLEKALLRIQIPNNIIQIIINLISNRTNQIITPHGLTNPYQVLGGIDQGDTLSPLLWRIYYDPLISHINKTSHGYHFKVHSNFPGTNNPKTQKTYFTSITFMDDTTWITRSKQDLEHIIHIANSFYKLNNLHINPQKSTLITINTKNNPNNIQFAGQTIHTQHKHDPIRILGVWITSSGKKTHQKNLIKEKTKNITQIISWKRITDKQCRYILNHVLMPALEYLLLDMVLNETECTQINSIILKTFKHKLRLPTTTINSAMHMHTSYKIFNIYDRQLEAHLKFWYQSINSSNINGIVTRGQLQYLQNYIWSTKSILQSKYTNIKKQNFSLTNQILNLLKNNNINIIPTHTQKLIHLPNSTFHPIETYVPHN